MTATPTGHLRRLAARAGVSLLTLLVLAAALEIALRAGWIANARHARLSAAPTPAEEVQVVLLGDSFAVPLGGFGVLLAEELGARGIGLLNLARSGTGPFEHLDELVAADDVSPALVVLCYYAGNDLTDVQNHPRYEGRDPSRAPVAIDRSSSRPLLNELYLYHFARAKLSRLRARALGLDDLAAAGVDPELVADARALRLNPWLVRLALRNPDHLLDNCLRETEGNARAWEKTVELLDGIRAVCMERGAELVVVAFPHTLQVDDSHADFFARLTYRIDPRLRETARPQEQLRAWCEERGVPLLDLLPDFRARAGEPLYLERDDHLSAAGNRLAAERVAAFLAVRLRRPAPERRRPSAGQPSGPRSERPQPGECSRGSRRGARRRRSPVGPAKLPVGRSS